MRTVVVDGRERFAPRDRFPSATSARRPPGRGRGAVYRTGRNSGRPRCPNYKYDIRLERCCNELQGTSVYSAARRRGEAIREFSREQGSLRGAVARIHVPIRSRHRRADGSRDRTQHPRRGDRATIGSSRNTLRDGNADEGRSRSPGSRSPGSGAAPRAREDRARRGGEGGFRKATCSPWRTSNAGGASWSRCTRSRSSDELHEDEAGSGSPPHRRGPRDARRSPRGVPIAHAPGNRSHRREALRSVNGIDGVCALYRLRRPGVNEGDIVARARSSRSCSGLDITGRSGSHAGGRSSVRPFRSLAVAALVQERGLTRRAGHVRRRVEGEARLVRLHHARLGVRGRGAGSRRAAARRCSTPAPRSS